MIKEGAKKLVRSSGMGVAAAFVIAVTIGAINPRHRNYSSSSESGLAVRSVKIGKQEWMVENLNVPVFRNGDPIPEMKTDKEWLNAYDNEKPAWCYYEDQAENGKKYGKLYNWYAVNDPRGLAPAGWHVPSDAEWTELTEHLGGNTIAGTKLKSAEGWEYSGGGTNETGFSALPGGARNFDGPFHYGGQAAYWWTSTPHSTLYAWSRFINFVNGTVERSTDIYYSKGLGISVRLVKD